MSGCEGYMANTWRQLADARGDYIRPVEQCAENLKGMDREICVEGRIHGVLASKSNNRKVIQRRGKPLIIQETSAYLFSDCVAAAANAYRDELTPPLQGKLWISATVWQKDLRRDLDIELLCDALQKAGVIKNDRAFFRKESTRQIDRLNPRVEFVVGRWE